MDEQEAEEWNIQYQILNMRIDLLSSSLPPNTWNTALASLYQDFAKLLSKRYDCAGSGYTQLGLFDQECPHLVTERIGPDV